MKQDKLKTETDEIEKKNLAEEISVKQKELRKQELTDQTAEEIKRIETEKSAKLKQLAYEQAVYEKATSITSAVINGLLAVVRVLEEVI